MDRTGSNHRDHLTENPYHAEIRNFGITNAVSRYHAPETPPRHGHVIWIRNAEDRFTVWLGWIDPLRVDRAFEVFRFLSLHVNLAIPTLGIHRAPRS